MLKILIIDDDMLTRKGIQMLMPWEKHEMKIVGESSNGQEALGFLEDHAVDLALVDLDMPVMDGMTFIEKASKLYPDLNYVVLTVHTEFEYIQGVLRAGAIDYIAKTQLIGVFSFFQESRKCGRSRRKIGVKELFGSAGDGEKSLFPGGDLQKAGQGVEAGLDGEGDVFSIGKGFRTV